MSTIFWENPYKKIKEQEETIKLLSDKIQILLIKNDKLINDYEALKITYNDYRNKKSVPINSRTSGKLSIINGVIRRDKSRSQSSSTNGGKSKKNKFRRSKYRITKRKY